MRTIQHPGQLHTLRVWPARADPSCLERLQRLARWDRLAGPIAVMPDVHVASEVCVGTVLATRDCILPTVIGQDLGCGMRTQCFDIDAARIERKRLERFISAVLDAVPVGSRSHREPQTLPTTLTEGLKNGALQHNKAWLGSRQFGTLGGGNHFIELQRDTLGRLWLTVHSGSRGIGAALAVHYKNAADRSGALPLLESNSDTAQAFLYDLNWALQYASENRACMLERATAVLKRLLGREPERLEGFDLAHNVISQERIGGEPLFIHRKGAMPAHLGARGIIPGSMGTASYIVEGLGNPASYCSSSHGAGRRRSREEARRRFTRKDLERQMKSVVFPQGAFFGRALIEEAPEAYKDIKEVLEEQTDLVKPVLRLEPLAVVKGP